MGGGDSLMRIDVNNAIDCCAFSCGIRTTISRVSIYNPQNIIFVEWPTVFSGAIGTQIKRHIHVIRIHCIIQVH